MFKTLQPLTQSPQTLEDLLIGRLSESLQELSKPLDTDAIDRNILKILASFVTVKDGEVYAKQFQATLHANSATYFLYGGARGPGKSYWLRNVLVLFLLAWAKRDIRNVRVGLFCEDYPSLTERQASKIAAEFPPEWGVLQTTRDDGYCFFLRSELGGGKIALAGH